MSAKKDSERRGPSRAVIWDIAQQSGVSIATVSRVLNGRPDVSISTREKVLGYVRELGYVSNRHARALVSGRVSYIGFMVPKIEHFTQVLAGATEAVEERDAHIVVCPTRHEHEREISLLGQLQAGGADGALLVLPTESSAELVQLRQQGYPFVVIDPRFSLDEGIPVVATANMGGGRVATEHLVALGHKRIGVITGPPGWCDSLDRLAGYHSVLFASGIANVPELVREGDFTHEGGYRAARQLLALSKRPTAIFAFNDDMALGAIRAAQEHSLAVPADLSVMGFADSPFAAMANPSLTSVFQPSYELGRSAVNLLYRILDGEQLEATRIELSTRLIVRASTTACKNAK